MISLGPVFSKELLEIARRPGYYFARMLLGLVVLIVIAVIYFDSPPSFGHRDTAKVGNHMFLGWLWVQCCALALLTPTFVCGTIAGEKDKATLETLFTTDLTSWEIIAGKLCSRWALILLILVSSLPVGTLLGLLGGVSYRDMLLGLALTVSVTAFLSALGVYFSLVTSKPWIAMLRTYMAGMTFWLLAPMVGVLVMHYWRLQNRTGREPPIVWFLLFLTQPIFDLALLTAPQGAPVPLFIDDMILLACSFWLFLAAILFIHCTRILRNCGVLGGPSWTWRLLHGMALALRHVLARFGEPVRKGLGPVSDRSARTGPLAERLLDWNPMFFRHYRGNAFDHDHHLLVIQLLGALITIFFFVIHVFDGSRRLGSAWAFMPALTGQMMALHFILVILAAGAIARETERGTLEQLALTSVTSFAIVSGYFVGVLKAMAPSFVLIAATLLFGWFTGAFRGNAQFLATYITVLAAITGTIVAEGLLVSTTCNSVTLATSRALVAPGLQWLIGVSMNSIPAGAFAWITAVAFIFLLLGFIGLKGDDGTRRLSAMVVALLLPLTMWQTLILCHNRRPEVSLRQGLNLVSWVADVSDDRGPFRQPTGTGTGMSGPHWTGPFRFDQLAPSFVAIQLLSTAAMLWLSSRTLPRLMGPQPQRPGPVAGSPQLQGK